DFSYFSDHIQFGDPEKTPLVNHLFNMKEEQWKIMRQKLSPAFTPSKLKLMYDPIVECSAQLLKNIETTLHESKTIEVRDIFENYSIDVIGTCAYGLKLNAINDSNSPFRKHGKSTFSQLFKAIFRDLCMLITPRLKPFLIISDFSKETVDFFTSTLKSTIKYREENNIKRNDVVKYLIRAKNDLIINKNSSSVRFQEMDIVANAFVMFIAGSEPISGTISFCLYELALKKDIQCQVRQEMLSVKLKHGTINSDYINDLQYLDMVILETLRKYPILSFLYRITTKPYAVPNDNLVIEKGTRIFIPAYYIHHDYRYYSDPMNFNPQRFSRENKANQQVGTYMPFGLGPRTCIGNHFADLEIKLALTDLLTRYDVEPCELTSIPMIFSKSSPLISPDNGIWLKFNTLNE
ncbi:probable cytochrome P450 6a14, partial [Daktulosphaira vitifoliae]